MSKELAQQIQELLILGKGDRGRLEYLLDQVQKRRFLPYSDQKYLESIIHLYLGSGDNESIETRSERAIEELQREVQGLNEKILVLESRGYERYVGKKTVFLFVTLYVGWNVMESFFAPFFNSFITENSRIYLFPLYHIANYFAAVPLLWLIFILMVLAWPFVGAIHLATFIKKRKIPKTPSKI